MNPLFALAAATLVAAAPVRAHEGHGDEAPAALSIPLAPRAETETDQIELLAVLDSGQLTFYIDRWATNEPLADARVEVDGAGIKAVATQSGPGVFVLPAPALTPGKHALTVTVEAGELADLLSVNLSLPAPDLPLEHPTGPAQWTVWGIAGTLVVAGVGLVALRRRRGRHRHPGGES